MNSSVVQQVEWCALTGSNRRHSPCKGAPLYKYQSLSANQTGVIVPVRMGSAYTGGTR